VRLLLAIEEFIKCKLEKMVVDEDEVLDDHTQLLKVMQVVRIKMSE